MKTVDIEIWRSTEEIEANRGVWEDLFRSSECSPYLGYDWFLTSLKYFPCGNRLRVGLLKVNYQPMAIVPLEFSREKTGPLTHTILQFALDGWALRNGAIVKDGFDELYAMREVVNSLRRTEPHWTYCCLSKYPEYSPTKQEKDQGESGAIRTDAVLFGHSVVIEIPESWEEYRKTLSRAHRSNISRRSNTMGRKGNIKMCRLGLDSNCDSHELKELMNDAVLVCKNSWQNTVAGGWAISDPKTGGFFLEVSEKLATKGMLDLSVLYLDKQPISFLWGAARGLHTTINKLGYDQSFSELSPGLVHLAKHIEDSIERGMKSIDFGHEFFDYKSSWGKRYDPLVTLFLYPPGILPSFIRWMRSRRLAPGPSNGIFQHKTCQSV